ncbi:hypothetical protein EDD18DRAFT_1361231 [Armillaria luteobubalina]|uniref:Uncharacterized protein n=1 Tax=Armillaria luteobubalina TaxID=153913 RepID=A0AA39PJA3_9AGAR|nr:hypothetical protein EDD18DRAFT_1361231 [Armillaria luteobubalina]
MLPRPRSSSSTASIISPANPDWLWVLMLGFAVPSSAGPGFHRPLDIMNTFLRAPSNGLGFSWCCGMLWSPLMLNKFTPWRRLRCGVIIDLIPEEQLAQYAAQAAAIPTGAEEAPFIVSDSPAIPLSPLMPGHASNFSSSNPPSPTPFALPLPILLLPVRTLSPFVPDLLPQDQSLLPLIPIILSSFLLPSMSPSTAEISSLPSAPVAGPSNTRKRPLVFSDDGKGTNKLQKGKGWATSSGHAATKQGQSRALTKNVCKTAIKGGLGELIPSDAVEVADLALMPLGLLVPDKDYGDFLGWLNLVMHASMLACNAGPFTLVLESALVNKACQVFVPHPALVKDLRTQFAQVLDEATRIADYQGKVPTTLRCQHANNVEQLLGLFELGVKEWKDLANAGDKDFEAEVEDEEENKGEPSGSQEEAN